MCQQALHSIKEAKEYLALVRSEKETEMAKRFMLVITHSTDDPDRTNSAIALAVSLIGEGADIAIFFSFEGALMAKKGIADQVTGENFTPVRELFPTILAEDVPLYVCGACAKKYNILEEDLVQGVKIVTLPILALEMQSRETITL
jgi:predicted peroxiredoxin